MMNSSSMASYVFQGIGKATTPESAIGNFYRSLCEYCESEMEVWYSWSSTDPLGVPDPEVLLKCKVKATGSISPSGSDTPESALSCFASDLNSQISKWEIIWPDGFVLPPAYIIPGIVFTSSGATTPEASWAHICGEIISGITKAATQGPLTGAHGAFVVPTPGAIWTKTI